MLKFNLDLFLLFYFLPNLNTSHVKVQPEGKYAYNYSRGNLNTSHVKVQLVIQKYLKGLKLI